MPEESGPSPEQRLELEQLEERLLRLLREKYRRYWRAKATPGVQAPDPSEFQGEIKEVFDAIRTLDKKYKIPAISMYAD